MGAALTYARRYALFTLVGIAGEDNLDAPDLIDPTPETENPRIKSNSKAGRQKDVGRLGGTGAKNSGALSLQPALSASLRDELLREIETLNALEKAARWAQRRLLAKNRLIAAHSEQVEEAFTVKIASMSPQNAENADARTSREGSRTAPIDKTLLAFPEQRRIRDRDHVRYVPQQPCLLCGRGYQMPTPSAVHARPRIWSQGQRRVCGAALSHAPS